MSSNDLFESIKENLNGRPGQPMLFGVCQSLAKRTGMESWQTRAIAIVLLFLFTMPTVVAYIILGLTLRETADRTQGIFQGLFVTLRECVDKVMNGFCDLFKPSSSSSNRY